MNVVETAVRWRHGTLAVYLLLVIFGLLAFFALPMELQPGGDVPKITITTPYPGAGPTTIEELITRPLEDLLEEVEGVQEMTSSSASGNSTITVEFEWGVDIKLKLIEVINKLNQVQSLPAEASEPNIQVASGGGGGNAMMWIVIRAAETEGAEPDANHFRDLVKEELIPELRRVQGTSSFIVVGGREKQVHVSVDPQKLAARGLSLSGLASALRANNRDVRGGQLVTGRREYRVSTKGRAKVVKELENFVLRRDKAGTVLVSDVAKVEVGRRFEDSFFLFKGKPAGAVGIVRQNGANVSVLSRKLREKIREVEARFQARGENVAIDVAYDQSGYVDQSIALVQSNLFLGAVLATIVLLAFLGSLRTVLVCAIAIPTTLVTVFVMLWGFGQTINILTLAGLAFAVGMVIDNAIVVVENVFKQMEHGKSPMAAAIEGAQEVSGALVASTLTTIAVFLPLVMVEGEVGRVFRAFGITLAAAVGLSFFAAVTLVPMLSGVLLTREDTHPDCEARGLRGLVARGARAFQTIQDGTVQFLTSSAEWSLDPEKRGRRFSVLGGCLALLTLAVVLLPSPDYLPGGNRNLIFWLMEPYPGTSVPEGREITSLPQEYLNGNERVGDTFMVYSTGFRGIGVKLKPELVSGGNLSAMQGELMGVGMGFPGFRQSFPIRFPIFNDPGKEIQVRVVGPDLERLVEMTEELQAQLGETEGVVGARSDFVFGAPELEVLPNLKRLAELDMEAAEVAAVVESALGGRFASEFVDGKETLDVVVKLQDVFVTSPEDLRQLQLVTPEGRRVQVQDVAEVVESTGPDKVNHVNIERSISLTVNIGPDAPLGATVAKVQELLDSKAPRLPSGYRIYIGGTADALTNTLTQLGSVFAFSLLITYLLLMALYRSFSYPLIILMTVPLGLTGAVLSLVLAQMIPGTDLALDMITAIGFVVLTGIVVNNAILLVDRALQLQRAGTEYWESVRQATHDRLRAILMSASTSVLGMLPLALIPGDGAELYQGLGVVLVGGLTFATFLTPTVVPALMGLFKDFDLVSEQGVNESSSSESKTLT